MLRHKSRNEVVYFPLSACDRHAAIIGEQKAKKQVGNELRLGELKLFVWFATPIGRAESFAQNIRKPECSLLLATH